MIHLDMLSNGRTASTPSKAASKPNRTRPALLPTRIGGHERVADILAAAAAVIQERGFDSATMTEIASRAGAKIGSLYRFFPNKDVLGEALLQRYTQAIDAAWADFDAHARVDSLEELADRLANFMVETHKEATALGPLMDSRMEWSGKRTELRDAALARIARALLTRAPTLPRNCADDMAVVLLSTMRTVLAMTYDRSRPSGSESAAEVLLMNRLYIVHKLACHSARESDADRHDKPLIENVDACPNFSK